MRTLSDAELKQLADDYNVKVDDQELDNIREQVNSNLEGIEAVLEVPTDSDVSPDGERQWWEPTDDPHNAVVVSCDVPPADGHSDLLAGFDVGVKDIIAVASVPMQCASGSMRGFVPTTDATCVERLRGAGGSITAKTNLDEFAGGARGVSFFGQITHPDNKDHIPGGSSGGSAIAVATGRVDVALGTDTGGSVRMPAAHCGLVGLKPTYGLVPLTGVVENTYTLDHVGPITKTVEESARVLEAMTGKDDTDSASLQAAGRDNYEVGGYVEAVENAPAVEDLTLGIVEEGLGRGVADQEVSVDVLERTEAAIKELEDSGATVENVSIETYELSGPVKYALSYSELAHHWRDAAGAYRRAGTVEEAYQSAMAARSESFSSEVNPYYRARLLAGAQLIKGHHGRHYTRAQHAREVIRSDFDDALEGVDTLVTPTLPILPPTVESAKDPGYHYSRNTYPANVTRLPAITVPNGRVDGLPVGLQLIGGAFEDASLLGTAETVESVL